MAVWNLIYGENKLNYNSKNLKELVSKLNTIKLNDRLILDCILDELEKNNNSLIESYENDFSGLFKWLSSLTEEEYIKWIEKANISYVSQGIIKSKFIQNANDDIELKRSQIKEIGSNLNSQNIDFKWEVKDNFLERIYVSKSRIGSFKIYFKNNLVEIYGPSEIFSYYGTFVYEISNETRLEFHNYFVSILKLFQSDFILYINETTEYEVLDSSNLNLKMIKDKILNKLENSISINEIKNYYLEKI